MSRKKVFIGIGVILSLVFIGGGIYLFQLNRYRAIVSNITLSDLEISSIEDGVYKGDFDAIFVGAAVTVTVKDGVIKDITLDKHKTEKGKEGEEVINEVLNQQSINVDAVSGATNSSRVILKAIEDALK